jgi:beta-lactamase class A
VTACSAETGHGTTVASCPKTRSPFRRTRPTPSETRSGDAAIRYSDGTAGNLPMRDIGGPGRLTAYLRELGDTVSRMDHYEPKLHRIGPRDPRDTTTPRAIGAERVQAGLPKGWRLADKTGTGDYGRANHIAIAWPPDSAPLVPAVIAVATTRRPWTPWSPRPRCSSSPASADAEPSSVRHSCVPFVVT